MDEQLVEKIYQVADTALKLSIESGFSREKAKGYTWPQVVEVSRYFELPHEDKVKTLSIYGNLVRVHYGNRVRHYSPIAPSKTQVKRARGADVQHGIEKKSEVGEKPTAACISLKGAMFSSCEYGFLPEPEWWRKLAKDGSYADGSVDSNLSLIKHCGKYLLTKCEHGFLVKKTLDQITVLTGADIERLLNIPEQRKAILKKLLEEA